MNAAKWARLLSDVDLNAEISELSAKCKSPVYGEGTAGRLLRAARKEFRHREADMMRPGSTTPAEDAAERKIVKGAKDSV